MKQRFLPVTFRISMTRSRTRHLLSTLWFVVITWVLSFVLAPWSIVQLEKYLSVPFFTAEWAFYCGIAVFTCGSIIGIMSCVTMAWHGDGTPMPTATAGQLVIAGPYRWVRNPMTLSGLMQGLGISLCWGSYTILIIMLGYFFIWYWRVRPAEEHFLEQQFGEDYRKYKNRVHAWWPIPNNKCQK